MLGENGDNTWNMKVSNNYNATKSFPRVEKRNNNLTKTYVGTVEDVLWNIL